jgi:hypothetical protein
MYGIKGFNRCPSVSDSDLEELFFLPVTLHLEPTVWRSGIFEAYLLVKRVEKVSISLLPIFFATSVYQNDSLILFCCGSVILLG